PRAMENDPAKTAIKLVEWNVQIDSLCAGQGGDHSSEQRVGVDFRPDGDSPFTKALPRVGHKNGRGRAMLRPQPLTDRAPAERTVEREVVRGKLFKASSTAIARAMLTVAINLPLGLFRLVSHPCDVEHALAQVEGRFHRVCQPGTGRPADDGPINHDL